jgi:hypothetical protein
MGHGRDAVEAGGADSIGAACDDVKPSYHHESEW